VFDEKNIWRFKQVYIKRIAILWVLVTRRRPGSHRQPGACPAATRRRGQSPARGAACTGTSRPRRGKPPSSCARSGTAGGRCYPDRIPEATLTVVKLMRTGNTFLANVQVVVVQAPNVDAGQLALGEVVELLAPRVLVVHVELKWVIFIYFWNQGAEGLEAGDVVCHLVRMFAKPASKLRWEKRLGWSVNTSYWFFVVFVVTKSV